MSIFMFYEGIAGETSDHSHQGWLDIKDVYWGVKRYITSHTSTRHDRESANAEISDLIVTRHTALFFQTGVEFEENSKQHRNVGF
ncbi:MAG: type VI secretion system tube protein Hcp [Aquisalimonadaceae bacterium]